MSKFWPEAGGVFDGIFSADTDPCPGEVIYDKYGLIEYAAHISVASSPRFARLDMNGLALLRLADPEECSEGSGPGPKARRGSEKEREADPWQPGLADRRPNPPSAGSGAGGPRPGRPHQGRGPGLDPQLADDHHVFHEDVKPGDLGFNLLRV